MYMKVSALYIFNPAKVCISPPGGIHSAQTKMGGKYNFYTLKHHHCLELNCEIISIIQAMYVFLNYSTSVLEQITFPCHLSTLCKY